MYFTEVNSKSHMQSECNVFYKRNVALDIPGSECGTSCNLDVWWEIGLLASEHNLQHSFFQVPFPCNTKGFQLDPVQPCVSRQRCKKTPRLHSRLRFNHPFCSLI